MANSDTATRGWMRRGRRGCRAIGVVALVVSIVAPALPARFHGPVLGAIGSTWERVSVTQRWQMYAPDPERSHLAMNLEAYAPGGPVEELEENRWEDAGWGVHPPWSKTRADLWRQYAILNPKQSTSVRRWYLRAACVRESRRGPVPQRLRIHAVRRRIRSPSRVRAGQRGLSPPDRWFVASHACAESTTRAMIERDRARRAGAHVD